MEWDWRILSREIKLSRIITEKIDRLEVDENTKSFLTDILNFERNIYNLEGKVTYTEQYKKLIEKYAPKEDFTS